MVQQNMTTGKTLILRLTLELTWRLTLRPCLYAASSTDDTRSSAGSPLSSASPGGYQDKTRTPDDTEKESDWTNLDQKHCMIHINLYFWSWKVKSFCFVPAVFKKFWWWKLQTKEQKILAVIYLTETYYGLMKPSKQRPTTISYSRLTWDRFMHSRPLSAQKGINRVNKLF